jgi:hypothetical protein
MRIIGTTTALISALMASVLGIVIAMLVACASGAQAAAPVKLLVERQFGKATPVKLVLAVVTLILAIWAPVAHAAGEPPVKEIVTSYIGPKGDDPTKWVLAFDVGRNVDSTRVHDPASTREERNECVARWRPDPPTHPAGWNTEVIKIRGLD